MPARTLNLGILAHVDAGKTSLTERLLFDNGAIAQLGSVDDGSTQTDTGDLERQRGITIRAAVASFTTGDLQVNLIDTPGHPDFIAEVERALAVLDGAVLVLSAVEGVQPQTRVLMKSLRKMRLPTLIFVNKIDRMGARQDDLLADIRRKLGLTVVAMNSVRAAGTRDARIIPRPLDQPDDRARMAEVLADNDGVLLARLVDDCLPSGEELRSLLARQAAAGVLHPVFFGSAISGQGAPELTDGISTLLRQPGARAAGSPADGAAGSPADGAAGSPAGRRAGSQEVSGTVFAIQRDASGEKVAYLRLFAGELRERQRVSFLRPEPGGRISEIPGQITGLEVIGASGPACAARAEPAHGPASPARPRSGRPRLTAGNIARLRGLSRVRVGDRLGEAASLAREPHFSPPSLETMVRPLHPGEASRLHAALMRLADEDPLIRARAAGGGATVVRLYGAVQKEIIEARLRRDFGIRAAFEQIQPVYLERPAGVGEASEEMSSYGQNPFIATIGLRAGPAPAGTGLSFTREVEFGALPRAFHRAIEETALRTLEQGLHGWEVTDCAVTLTRTGYSSPLSAAADFRNLTPLVLMRALREAGTRIYEPCHRFEVEIPGEVLSNVIGYLTGLEADIRDMAETGESWQISGEIPARLVQEFTMALPGLSRGEGAWWYRPGGDRPVRGQLPVRERADGNPLNRDEYLRFLANRGTGSPGAGSAGAGSAGAAAGNR